MLSTFQFHHILSKIGEELKSKLDGKHVNSRFLCDALLEIKYFQDLLEKSSSKYYGHLLLKMLGSDTIPVTFTTNIGSPLSLIEAGTGTETRYFRIEHIDEEKHLVIVSLLRPLDIFGDIAKSMSDVVKLEKTTTKNTLSLMLISGVQLFNTTLLTKKMIIEPKW